jgi:hypothetical protein
MAMKTRNRRHKMLPLDERYKTGGKRLTRSFVTGLASLITISEAAPKSVLETRKSNVKALRGDFERIGADMFLAVANEKHREKAAS